jgi:uncharacterized tellurite resistance protein B-like protein
MATRKLTSLLINMDLKTFTPAQKQALLDLTVLAMYADGHLALKEDERIHRLIGEMGYAEELERDQLFDMSISRISRHSQTAAMVRDHATTLASCFSGSEQRLAVSDILNDVVRSDNKVAPAEDSFLALVRSVLK